MKPGTGEIDIFTTAAGEDSASHEKFSIESLADRFKQIQNKHHKQPSNSAISRICTGHESLVLVLDDGRVHGIHVPERYIGPLHAVSLRLSVDQIAFGKKHMIVMTRSGDLWSAGGNSYGQLGRGTIHNHIEVLGRIRRPEGKSIQIACGAYHSLCLTEKSHVYSWGFGKAGQLGTGQSIQLVPRYVSKLGPPLSVQRISAGHSFSVALSSKGELFTWGDSICRQTGVGRKTSQLYPAKVETDAMFCDVQCGFAHTIAVESNKKLLYAWGLAYNGQLGNGGFKTKSSSSIISLELREKEFIDSISCGPFSTVALLSSGRILNCGSTSEGAVFNPVEAMLDKHVSVAVASPTNLVCFTATSIKDSSAKVACASGGTEIVLTGYAFSNQSLEGTVRFTVDGDSSLSIDQPIASINASVACASPSLELVDSNFPAKLGVQLSFDACKTFTNCVYLPLYRNPSKFETTPVFCSPITGKFPTELEIKLDDVQYTDLIIQLCPLELQDQDPPSTSGEYDSSRSVLLFNAPAVSKPGKYVVSLSLDGTSYIDFSRDESPTFVYTEAKVIEIEPLVQPWTGTETILTIQGIPEQVRQAKNYGIKIRVRSGEESSALCAEELPSQADDSDIRKYKITLPNAESGGDRSRTIGYDFTINGESFVPAGELKYSSACIETVSPSCGSVKGDTKVELKGDGFFGGDTIRVRFHKEVNEEGHAEKEEPKEIQGSFIADSRSVSIDTPNLPSGKYKMDIAIDHGETVGDFSTNDVFFEFYDEPGALKPDKASQSLEGNESIVFSGKNLFESKCAKFKFTGTYTVEEEEKTEQHIVDAQAQVEPDKKGVPIVSYIVVAPAFEQACKADVEIALNGLDFLSASCAIIYTSPK